MNYVLAIGKKAYVFLGKTPTGDTLPDCWAFYLLCATYKDAIGANSQSYISAINKTNFYEQ
jgi:hypothetical protein